MRRSGLIAAAVIFSSSLCGAESSNAARNVILFVGDGFGASQMALALQYARLVESRPLHLESLMKDGNSGYSLAMGYQSAVTDSAAAASQIATGRPARNETLSLSPDGYANETVLEWASRSGLRTGLVTNMRLSHATPAAFASHVISRYEDESEILRQILEEHDVDVLLGGGARALVPAGRRVSEYLPGIPEELDGMSNRNDAENRVEAARQRGYTVVSDRTSLLDASLSSEKLLGLFAASHIPYVVDKRALGLTEVPSLADLTSSALSVLDGSDQGFFVMVEGGRIDYGGHDNDAGTMLHEILDFDEALGVGLDFQRRHPDTLVIVTADHGTGGFSFTYGSLERTLSTRTLSSGLTYDPHHIYAGRSELLLLANQSASFELILRKAAGSVERLVEVVREHVGITLTPDEARQALARDADGNAWVDDFRHYYGDQDSNPACKLARALARQTFVVWSTGGHTTEPVLTFGRGPGASRLRGLYENTHLFTVMQEALSSFHRGS